MKSLALATDPFRLIIAMTAKFSWINQRTVFIGQHYKQLGVCKVYETLMMLIFAHFAGIGVRKWRFSVCELSSI